MKKFLILTFCFSLFATQTARAAQGMDWSKIYDQVKPAIPVLVMNGGYCSGALIEKDLVLTAAHCIASLRTISVTWPSEFGKFETGKVVGIDKKTDIALIRLFSARSERPIALLPKNKNPKVGDAIATVGHPATPDIEWGSKYPFKKDETYLMSSGLVSGLTEDDIITDMSLTPGNSGGPIFNEDGELIAVVSRKRIGPAVGAIGFATNREKIAELIEKNKKDGDQEYSIFKARTGAEFSITISDGSLAESERSARFWTSGFELRVALWDRLFVGYGSSFNSLPRLSSWIIGPKFVFDGKSGHVWVLSPQVEYSSLRYNLNSTGAEQNEKLWLYSLYFRTSRFPFGLKMSYANRNGNSEYLAFLHLPLF